MNSNEEKQILLQVKDLSIGIEKDGGDFTAVDGVSYDVYEGEILGVVGESGCGKSVTNYAIMGLLADVLYYKSGEILLREKDGSTLDLTKISEEERRGVNGNDIAMIYQEPLTSLNPLMKIGRQVAEPVRNHNRDLPEQEIRARVVKSLTEVGLPDPEAALEMYPHQLSGGMRQRVMIAMATVCRPRLLIADEPTTALDVTVQAQVLRLLRHINRKHGMSIIFISHDLSVVRQICDRVAVMYAGRIVETASAKEIMTNPQHEYTKGLIRSIPTLQAKGDDLPCIPGRVPSTEEEKDPCPFAPRCTKAQEICKKEVPPCKEAGEGHQVYCHFA